MPAPVPTDTYAFNNDDAEAADRHAYLATMLDEFTCARLARVGDLTGRRCLELGAGGGSVARWLAGQVGDSGLVVATDLNTRHFPEHPGYTVLQHDLANEPLPDGPWDLIHARLVLTHLPSRDEILPRLVNALAPGGVLALEEWDNTVGDWALATPDPQAAELLSDFQRAVGRILANHGQDRLWARRLHNAFLQAGLADVDTEVHARAWPGGTPGTMLLVVNLDQLRSQLAADFTDEQLAEVRRLAQDPSVVWRGLMTYSTFGRRPAKGA